MANEYIPPLWLWIADGARTRGGPEDVEPETGPTPLSVLIVTADLLLPIVLHHVLAPQSDIEILDVAATPQEAIDALQTCFPSVLILDPEASLHDDALIHRHLKEHDPSQPVLTVISHFDLEGWRRDYRNGVRGWIHKHEVLDLLPCAIRGLTDGGSWFGPTSMRLLFEEMEARAARLQELERRLRFQESPLAKLTPRQREILADLVAGLSHRQIAARRFISPKTVKGHVTGILRVLGVGSSEEAVELARSFGWPW